MRIGELSQRVETSERALRYYEQQGLLQPARRASGYREYDEADMRKVQRIRTLLAAGMSTASIAEVLPCMLDSGDVVALGCPELVGHLERERERIDRSIDELRAARAILDQVIAATPAEGAACAG